MKDLNKMYILSQIMYILHIKLFKQTKENKI
jgi:hypothetical protein